MREWRDPAEELAENKRAVTTWSRISSLYAASTTARTATSLADLRASYPTLRPGVALPLAQSGAGPDDPLTVETAIRDAKAVKRKRGAFASLGDFVSSPKRLLSDVGQFAVGDILNPLGGLASGGLKTATRGVTSVLGGAAEETWGLVRNVAATGGEVVAGAASGAVTGAGIGAFGFTPFSVAAGLVGGAVAGGVAGGLAQARGIDVEGEAQWKPQSALGVALTTGKSIGSGYLPGGEAQTEAVRRQRAAASINGHVFTAGRFLASAVAEPGSKPYTLLSGLIDTSNAIKVDPAAIGLAKVGRLRKAGKLFVPDDVKIAAGAVDASRRTVLPERVSSFLSSKDGTQLLSKIAEDADFESIRLALPGVDVRTVLELADTRTVEDAAAVLRPKLGLDRGLVEKPSVGGRFGLDVKRTLQSRSRLFHDMPSGKLDLKDPTQATEEYVRLMHNARFDAETISSNSRRFAEALLSGDHKIAEQTFIGDFLGGTKGALVKANMHPELARKLTRDLVAERAAIFDDMVTEDAAGTVVTRVMLGGVDHPTLPGFADAGHPLPLPGLFAEHMENSIDFDLRTIRDIRRATSRLGRLVNNPAWTKSAALGDFVTNDIWKPMALLRGAWTVRVVGEEQVRMAASGLDSAFNHPLSYMSLLAADDTRIGNVLSKFGIKGRAGIDFTEEAWSRAGPDLEAQLRGASNEFLDSLATKQQNLGWHDKTLVKDKGRVTYQPHQKGYNQSWAEQIERLHRDPVVRRIAASDGNLDEIHAWFSTGEGSDLRQILVRDTAGRMQSTDDVTKYLGNARKQAQHAAGHVEGARNADPRILSAIADGRIDDIPIYAPDGKLNKAFTDRLQGLVDEGVSPKDIVGDALAPASLKARHDKAVDRMFGFFMGNRTAELSRSPTFRQSYWNEAEDLVFNMPADDQVKLFAAAEKANLKPEQIARLRKRAALGTGDLTLHEADLLAKGRALDFTKGLLYEASKRGQVSDSLRILYPFLEAQKEVTKTWLTLGAAKPQVARRAQQVIEGARGANIFYTDPQTGEEMVAFPGSEILTEKILGVPVKLGGHAAGLSFFGSGLVPGVGPVGQLAVKWLVPDTPTYDDLREFLDPFATVGGGEGGLLESHLPSWAQKIRQGLSANESDARFAGAVIDVWRSGISSGHYSSETPEDVAEGLADAKEKAKWLRLIQGAASFGGAPVSLTPEFLAQDKAGTWIVADKLISEYREMMADPEIGPENASAAFLEKFGDNTYTYMQSKSWTPGVSAPTGKDAATWIRENPDLVKKYPDAYGLFAPQEGEYDYDTHLRQIRSGERVILTPDQAAKKANDRVAKMAYYNVKDRFGTYPSQAQRQFLAQYKEALMEDYPGAWEDVGLPEKLRPSNPDEWNRLLTQIEEAANDPKLADTDIADATRKYLIVREYMNKQAQAGGLKTFTSARAAAPLRAWMRDFMDVLVEETPEFATLAERVFSREMIDDDITPETQTAPPV